MTRTKCPYCNREVFPKPDGSCPHCGGAVKQSVHKPTKKLKIGKNVEESYSSGYSTGIAEGIMPILWFVLVVIILLIIAGIAMV